jgi:CheY-like chemotaxis protein
VVAENGAEALAACAHEDFDLILMDLQMPVMNGLDATQAIRQRERGTARHVPIVALTAHVMKGDREICVQQRRIGFPPQKRKRGAEWYRRSSDYYSIPRG